MEDKGKASISRLFDNRRASHTLIIDDSCRSLLPKGLDWGDMAAQFLSTLEAIMKLLATSHLYVKGTTIPLCHADTCQPIRNASIGHILTV